MAKYFSKKSSGEDASPITKEMLKRCMPAKVHGNLSDEFVLTLNNNITDPNFREIYRENLLGFTAILQEGRYKLQSYVDAVKFVSYKLLGSTDVKAYAQTFPDRYQRLLDAGSDSKTISSYVSAYKNKNQIVSKVFEQSMMPTHIINADLFQKAINSQADLMINARSEKVRSDAANSLLTHLKPPETKKVEVDIGVNQDSGISELRKATQELVRIEKQRIIDKTLTPQEVAQSKLNRAVEIEDV